MRIAVFIPCYVDQVLPSVGQATVRILRRLGHEVVYPADQTCCGQPAFNTGYWKEAAELAARQTRIFIDAEPDAVVCPSGSCTAMQKVFYPTLLKDGPCEADGHALGEISWELSQFLVHKLGVTDLGASFPGTAVFHPSCHSLRELGATNEAETLLKNVKGLELRPMPNARECCGFGGTFAVKMADISTAMGEVKVNGIVESGADWVISADSSCLMHVGGMLEKRGHKPKTIHLAEVLASTKE
ncbi:MAG: (Fe-S)-binding protein [Planctomycetia bacterium]